NSGYTLLQRFRRLIARRSVRDLDGWAGGRSFDRTPSVRQPRAWHSDRLRSGRQWTEVAMVYRTSGRYRDQSEIAEAPGIWPSLHTAAPAPCHKRRLIEPSSWAVISRQAR